MMLIKEQRRRKMSKKQEFPHLESISRITRLPMVESSLILASGFYTKVKCSSSLIHWGLTKAESSVHGALGRAIPAANALEKPINLLDTAMCRGLDVVEKKLPAITLPPTMLRQGEKLTNFNNHTVISRVHGKAMVQQEMKHVETVVSSSEIIYPSPLLAAMSHYYKKREHWSQVWESKLNQGTIYAIQTKQNATTTLRLKDFQSIAYRLLAKEGLHTVTIEDTQGTLLKLWMEDYLLKFAPNIANKTNPLRELLLTDTEFPWTSVHTSIFNELYASTKDFVSTTLVQPVLRRADSVLACKYTNLAAEKIDSALDVADKYVDQYLPKTADENTAEPGSWEMHLFWQVQSFRGGGGFGADSWPISAFGLASVFDLISISYTDANHNTCTRTRINAKTTAGDRRERRKRHGAVADRTSDGQLELTRLVPQNCEVDGRAVVHTIHHVDHFSRKLRRRLTQRTLLEAKALKQQSEDLLHTLIQLAELVGNFSL
uniref:Uncharacterized protein n=1 Tax=Timema poppense TaxID=170557 RepID=A0A7R9D909_TIMPO|nr:unnamed protein product [Timema poppensis]